MKFILDVDYTICITCIMYQQLWGYKVEEKLYLGVREQKKVEYHWPKRIMTWSPEETRRGRHEMKWEKEV
jgi:hypothetical protein